MAASIATALGDNDKQKVTFKSNSESAKKMEVTKEIRQMNIKIDNMDKEKSTHLYNKRSDFRKDFSQLEELDMKLVQERKAEKLKVKQQLGKIRNMVGKFHREVRDVKPTPEFVSKLKIVMEEVESTISGYKEQQRKRYEEILREERTTSQEITALERKFDTWSQIRDAPTDAKKTPKPLKSARDITKDLPPEVAAFERFLEQTGGHRGGWDEYDHQTFIKHRNKHRGKPLFIREVVPFIPTQTESAIRDHESWFQEYRMLNQRKKDAIHKWRIQKEQEKQEAMEAKKAEEDSDSEDDEKKKEIRIKIEEEKKERFSRINAWKVQRELERIAEQERELKEELRKANEKEQFKQRQVEMRTKVGDFRRLKQEEEEFLRLEEEIREESERETRLRQLSRDKPRLQERNKRMLDQKLAREREKEEAEAEKQKRLQRLKAQVEVEVKRDPTRLYRPTKGWEERTKEREAGGGRVLHMPHRAIPSWRAGLH